MPMPAGGVNEGATVEAVTGRLSEGTRGGELSFGLVVKEGRSVKSRSSTLCLGVGTIIADAVTVGAYQVFWCRGEPSDTDDVIDVNEIEGSGVVGLINRGVLVGDGGWTSDPTNKSAVAREMVWTRGEPNCEPNKSGLLALPCIAGEGDER